MKTMPTKGVTELARESAIGLGHLVGQHLKIARLEVTAELHAMSLRARVVAVLATLMALGYALAMAGLAVVIGGHADVGIPLALVGVAHVGGAGAALALTGHRARGSTPVAHTELAVGRSLAALERATAPTVPVAFAAAPNGIDGVDAR